jgi:uncharacterized surface protein with fasciclin (FAS1) repeats
MWMDELRKIAALLTLSVVALALMDPAMAQARCIPAPSVATIPIERSSKDMVTAIMDTKETSTAASIIKTVRLDGIMTPDGKYTWFVASDQAMEAMRPDMRNRMMEKMRDPETASKLVKGHLVSGVVTPDAMTEGKTLTMMNGNTMTVRVMDGRIMVDDAPISKAVMANNGVIYVMDRIPASIMAMVGQPGMAPMSDMQMGR